MTPQTFLNYIGQEVPNNHGKFVGECVSLAARFAQEVQGVPDADSVFYCSVTGGARDLYEQYDGKIPTYFDRIPYGQPPKLYDYIVWGANRGHYGHIAIIYGSQVFQQLGTPVFKPAELASSGTQPPLGYLRLKGGTVDINYDALVRRLLSLSTLMAQPGNAPDRQPTTQEMEDGISRTKLDIVAYIDNLMGTAPWGANWNKVKHYNEDVNTGFKPYSGPPLFTK